MTPVTEFMVWAPSYITTARSGMSGSRKRMTRLAPSASMPWPFGTVTACTPLAASLPVVGSTAR